MSAKRGFFVVFLMVMGLLLLSLPHQAFAQTVGSTADVCGTPGSNATDTNFQNAMNAAGTRVSQDVTNFWNGMNKISTSSLQCITNLRNLYASIASSINAVSDPLGLIMAVVGPLVIGLVNQICTMVMSDVMQVANAALSMLHICLPLPSFGLGGLNLNLPSGCRGGLQIPLLSGTGAGMAPPQYSLAPFPH